MKNKRTTQLQHRVASTRRISVPALARRSLLSRRSAVKADGEGGFFKTSASEVVRDSRIVNRFDGSPTQHFKLNRPAMKSSTVSATSSLICLILLIALASASGQLAPTREVPRNQPLEFYDNP